MIVIYFFSTKSQQFFAYVWAIFPVIAFFLVSFYTLDFLFSPSYLIMVPVFTIMFKINYKKDYSFVALLKMSIRQFVISFLAFIASSSFSWSIILNSSVTFLIVYLFYSSATPMRYHSYLMMFTFCQLIQVKGNTFLMQSQVVAFLIGLFLLALTLNAWWQTGLSQLTSLKSRGHVRFFKSIQLNMKQQKLTVINFWHDLQQTFFGITSFKQFLESPDEAEMNTRIKTRFWGTLLGCFLSLFVVNWLQLPLTHLIVSSLIGIFVYALKPGTVLQVTMATIFGLCLATISLRGMYAAELRVSFVLLAIFVVCLIDLGLFVYQRILRF
ncbi:FUSC family protein [Enterococcus faecalis]|nr:FUSC family protein [Enterococcus faecalis]